MKHAALIPILLGLGTMPGWFSSHTYTGPVISASENISNLSGLWHDPTDGTLYAVQDTKALWHYTADGAPIGAKVTIQWPTSGVPIPEAGGLEALCRMPDGTWCVMDEGVPSQSKCPAIARFSLSAGQTTVPYSSLVIRQMTAMQTTLTSQGVEAMDYDAETGLHYLAWQEINASIQPGILAYDWTADALSGLWNTWDKLVVPGVVGRNTYITDLKIVVLPDGTKSMFLLCRNNGNTPDLGNRVVEVDPLTGDFRSAWQHNQTSVIEGLAFTPDMARMWMCHEGKTNDFLRWDLVP